MPNTENLQETWIRGQDYPEYWTDPDLTEQELLDELYKQNRFDFDGNAR